MATRHSELEWTRKYQDVDGTDYVLSISGILLSTTGDIIGVDVIKSYKESSITAYIFLKPSDIPGFDGFKQFHLEENGTVSLYDNCDGFITTEINIPDVNFQNPVTISYNKWLNDYITCNNKRHTSKEDKFYKVEMIGPKLNCDGIIREFYVKVTFDKIYGSCGRLTIDKSIRLTNDILGVCGVYGLERLNIITDDWTPTCFGQHGYRAYFDKNYNLVFDDDGRYEKAHTDLFYINL